MESEVLYVPVPAIIGIRPPAAKTPSLKIEICSSSERVGASPVVPHNTIASVPEAMCHSIKAQSVSKSTSFSAVKGVTSATRVPLNMDHPLPLCYTGAEEKNQALV